MVAIFVTGTDTGVGKTFVATALCREGVRRGWSVLGHKPIETGCALVDGKATPADALALVEAAGGWQKTDEAICQYRFEPPVAPLAAATLANVRIDLVKVVSAIHRLAAARDLAIVEGAGGWRVPITPTDDMGGLACRLGWPVLIVARAGLGTINHSLLTVEAVEYDGCEVWGIALSVLPTDDRDFARENRDEIARRAGCPVWLFDAATVLDRAPQL